MPSWTKLAPHALQLLMLPLFPSYCPIGITRWVMNQKNTLTLSRRDEFHIVLLVLSTKTNQQLHGPICWRTSHDASIIFSPSGSSTRRNLLIYLILLSTYIQQDPILNTRVACLQPRTISSPPQPHRLVDSPSISCRLPIFTHFSLLTLSYRTIRFTY